MRPNRDLLASIAGAVGALGAFLAVLNLLGTLLFFETSKAWNYVPPLGALGLLTVAVVGRGFVALALAWSLAVLIVASYVVENWQWTVERADPSWLGVTPELLQTLLSVIALVGLHLKILRARAVSDIR